MCKLKCFCVPFYHTDHEPSEANARHHQCHLWGENFWEWRWLRWSWTWSLCEWFQNTIRLCIYMFECYSNHLVTQSHQKDRSIRIHIIATYAVHARPLLCEVAPPTKGSIHGACLLVYFPSLSCPHAGKQAGTSLPSSPVPHLWVVYSGVVASWWPGFTLHCTREGECVKQNPCLSPVWFHWGSEHDHSD